MIKLVFVLMLVILTGCSTTGGDTITLPAPPPVQY